MKKLFYISFLSFLLISCDSLGTILSSPGIYQGGGYGSSSSAQAEREYQAVAANYQEDSASVLSELLSDDAASSNAAIVIENASACNIVITVSGNGYYKKVPIAAGKIRGVVVKKGVYRLSGQVCNARYDQVKNADTSVTIKLRN